MIDKDNCQTLSKEGKQIVAIMRILMESWSYVNILDIKSQTFYAILSANNLH